MEDIFEKMLDLKEDQYSDLRSKMVSIMYDLGYAIVSEQRLEGERILSFRKTGDSPEIDIVIKNEKTS